MKLRMTIVALGLTAVWAMSQARSQDAPKPKQVDSRKQLLRQLDSPVSVVGRRMPIQEAVGQVAKQAKFKVEIDGNGFKFEGYTKNMSCNLEIKNQSARLALATIIAPFSSLVIATDAKGESLIVTSIRAAAKRQLVQVKLVRARERWSDVMPTAFLDQLVKQTISRLQADVATTADFQRNYRRAEDDAAVLAFVALIVEDVQPESTAWRKNANTVRATAMELHATASKKGRPEFPPAEAAIANLKLLVAGKPIKNPPKALPFELDPLLPHLMKRMNQAEKTVKTISSSTEITPKQLESLRHEAAWMATVANALQMEGHGRSDEDSWLAHAKQLETTATQLQIAVSPSDLAVKIGKSCAACHREYR
ncbi:MAG: hypothetical protein O3A00_25795 [Planctomycetota bacterium]|nr:hypothetical protein [Planctomycetota bacterium]